MKKIIQEFKDFAIQGNMIDMAVGIIIGSAFGKIITSLVNDIIMPPIAALIGNVKFTDLAVTLKEATKTDAGEEIAAITLNYGNFIQVCFDFLIVAICIFTVIRLMAKLKDTVAPKGEAKEEPAPEPAPSKEEMLLTEIRDLLKEQKEQAK